MSAAKQRALLAALLVRAGRPVSLDELAECVWADDVPRRMVSALRVYVMRLRQVLGGPESIETTSTGYVLRAGRDALDLGRFEDLAARGLAASAADDLGAAAALFDRALGEWRGAALEDVPSPYLHRVEVPRLCERKLDVEAARNDVVLRGGGHRELVGRLRGLTEAHPLREQFWAQLMLALYRSGERARAMDAYRTVRDLLADRLGIGPGQEVEGLHAAILARDPALDLAVRERVAVATPSQVAPVVADFVGRDAEAATIAELVGAGLAEATMPVVTICGPPGVGKTALATFAARGLRDRFPDGQLFADLRGHSGGPPRPASSVLAGFLRALGVPPGRVPVEQDEQAAVFRAALDGRRVLVVLDNAAAAAQVRPLLPGTPGCAVLVTSRHELRGLIVTNDARLVPLGVLAPAAAVELLARILGADAAAAQAGAVRELADLCGHLPLALRTAAANLVGRPRPDVAAHVAELRSGSLLAAPGTVGGEAATRAAFDLSHAKLPPPIQRTFGLVGLVPGPDFTPEAVAALADLPAGQAARHLERLASANLVQRRPGGRYHLHDLLRDYALLRQAEQDGAARGGAALRRLFTWYLRAADRASSVLHPELPKTALVAPGPAAAPPAFADRDAARTWLDDERANLLAAAEYGAGHGLLAPSRQIIERLWVYLGMTGHRTEQLSTTNAVLAAAEREGDRTAQTVLRLHLAWAYRNLGDHRVARRHAERALAEGPGHVEPRVLAAAHGVLGTILLDLGELADARRHLERTRRFDQSDAAAAFLRTWALIGLGTVELFGGRPVEARGHAGAALDLARRNRAAGHEAEALALLGRARTVEGDGDGDYAAAIAHLGDALDLARRADLVFRPLIMAYLADALDRGGEHAAALTTARNALEVARERGGRWNDVAVRNVLGAILCRRGDVSGAISWHEGALKRAESGGYPFGVAQALLGLARARSRAREPEAAARHARDALAVAAAHGFALHEIAAAELMSGSGEVFAGSGS